MARKLPPEHWQLKMYLKSAPFRIANVLEIVQKMGRERWEEIREREGFGEKYQEGGGGKEKEYKRGGDMEGNLHRSF